MTAPSHSRAPRSNSIFLALILAAIALGILQGVAEAALAVQDLFN